MARWALEQVGERFSRPRGCATLAADRADHIRKLLALRKRSVGAVCCRATQKLGHRRPLARGGASDEIVELGIESDAAHLRTERITGPHPRITKAEDLRRPMATDASAASGSFAGVTSRHASCPYVESPVLSETTY